MKSLSVLAAFAMALGLFVSALGGATAARSYVCLGQRATIVAPAGGGTVLGTPGDDVVYGSGRADIIFGNGGNDTICGRGGNDVIYATSTSEPVTAGDRACKDVDDTTESTKVAIDGGSGNDVICGPSSSGGGYWTANGSSGNDVIGPALGVDEHIYGGSGADEVNGALKYPGNLNSYSNAYGGSGNDRVEAGPMFYYAPIPVTPYHVIADGGSGNDTVHGAATDQVSGVLTGGSGVDTCALAIGTLTVEITFSSSCETTSP